jgi:rubrerythrin
MAEQPDFEELQRQLRDAADEGHEQADELLRKVDEYHASDTGEERESLRRQLSDAIYHFEAEHPRLTAAIQQVVNSLTAAGI